MCCGTVVQHTANQNQIEGPQQVHDIWTTQPFVPAG